MAPSEGFSLSGIIGADLLLLHEAEVVLFELNMAFGQAIRKIFSASETCCQNWDDRWEEI